LTLKVHHQGGNKQHFVKTRIVFVIKDGRVDRNCHFHLVFQTQWDVFAREEKNTFGKRFLFSFVTELETVITRRLFPCQLPKNK
jgi:hypothetical protein